jgi:hypothetical protein
MAGKTGQGWKGRAVPLSGPIPCTTMGIYILFSKMNDQREEM